MRGRQSSTLEFVFLSSRFYHAWFYHIRLVYYVCMAGGQAGRQAVIGSAGVFSCCLTCMHAVEGISPESSTVAYCFKSKAGIRRASFSTASRRGWWDSPSRLIDHISWLGSNCSLYDRTRAKDFAANALFCM